VVPGEHRWRRGSLRVLERELDRNTFPSGVNRELASDYHGFVAEIGSFAAVEASAAGIPMSDATWRLLCAMGDVMAALVDVRVQPPRQGDSDEGRVVLLDAPEHNRWPALLSLSEAIFGRLTWWPVVQPAVASTLVGALLGDKQQIGGRPSTRPDRFADAGITILRTRATDSEPEIWVRTDGGPHGFLSIAAHAHADALSVEVRHGGTDILADPGTYCYHGEPDWRRYFQSTIGHNTLEVDGQWQSIRGGSFLVRRHARGREVDVALDGTIASWTGEHDGYTMLKLPATHRRTVRLDRKARSIDIVDAVEGGSHRLRLAFHFGPQVQVRFAAADAALSWGGPSGGGGARLELPSELNWTLHRGETDPVLGWYSTGLGDREEAFTLLGEGSCQSGHALRTRLTFTEPGRRTPSEAT